MWLNAFIKIKKSKQSIFLASISVFNIAVVFVLQMITFNVVGAGDETDALFLGLAIPTLILSITVTALNNVLVPLFSGRNILEVKLISKNVFLVLCGLGCVLTIILQMTLDIWLPLIANGFSYEKLELAKLLTRIQLMVVPLSILYSIQWSVLNGQKRHLESEMSPALINVFLLPIIYFLLKKYGVVAIAIAYPIRVFLQNIVLYILLGKGYIGFVRISKHELYLIWNKLKPMMLGSIYYKSEPVIDRSLLSNTASGTLSVFFMAQQVYSAMSQIIVKSIVTPSIARLSESYNNKNEKEFNLLYKETFVRLFYVLVFIFICFLIFGRYASNLILSIKVHTNSSGEDLYNILFLLYGSFVGNVLGTISSSTFYARGNTKTPSYISMFTYTAYLPIKVFLFIWFGVKGLALTISIYSLVNVILMTYVYLSRYKINN